MTGLNGRTIAGVKVFALASILAVVGVLLATPVLAQAPPGASEVEEDQLGDLPPIWTFDEDDELHKFVIEENELRGYSTGMELMEEDWLGVHMPRGSLPLGDVIAYRAVQVAFEQLWPEEVPNLADFAVAYKNPDKDQQVALEYITRVFSRGEGDVDPYPGVTQDNFGADSYQYVFTNLDSGETFETGVLEEVFPDGFFDLWMKVKAGTATDAEKAAYLGEFEEVRSAFLEAEALDELFEVGEEDEPTPYWQVIFTLGLFGVTVVGTGYSYLIRRKTQTWE